jgi:hypothetical protein
LVSVAGAQIVPGWSLVRVLLSSALGAAVLVAALVVAAIAWLALGQFILRKGGTDVQWLWFPGDPPGLEGLRRRARDRKACVQGSTALRRQQAQWFPGQPVGPFAAEILIKTGSSQRIPVSSSYRNRSYSGAAARAMPRQIVAAAMSGGSSCRRPSAARVSVSVR